jgi:hypothetical protein
MPSTTASTPAPSNVISGKILHKESGNGVADLLVELYDLDNWVDPEGGRPAGDLPDISAIVRGDLSSLNKLAKRVASTLTTRSGEFTIPVTTKDFNVNGRSEQKPDLLLLVLGPDEPGYDLEKRLLHFAKDVRFNAGTNEAYIIRLPTRLLEEREIPFGDRKTESQQVTKHRLQAYADERTRESEFNTGAADYHAVHAKRDREQRTAFRKTLLKKLRKNLEKAPLAGVLAREGDDVLDKNVETIGAGVTTANAALHSSSGGVPVNLYISPADMPRFSEYFQNATEAWVEIPDEVVGDVLFRASATDNPGTLLIRNSPIASACSTETAEDRCARLHAGLEAEQEHEHGGEPATPDGPSSTSNIEISESRLLAYVDRLVKDLPAPDAVLRPELVQKRADKAVIDKAISEFALPKGPAEVPAFYDFHSLQIAFDHVWKQLFDETIPNLAYTANTLGKAQFGVNDLVGDVFNHGLLDAELSLSVAPVEVPPVVAKHFDITREEFNEMTFAIRNELVAIANAIDQQSHKTLTLMGFAVPMPNALYVSELRQVQALMDQGERLIDCVRHDDFYTLHKTLRDLNARLSGTYEFTVFAADKDHHSVNFGLLNTYRQQWCPLTYQAGELVKSLSLTAKEERQVSYKVVRHEKASTKEARKNNSTITNEQSSTSRVEAEIMAKAQNKSNFGLNTEGNFQFGIYEGKATTTFGVEALSESSQNRKDMRDAVLKAVQDYKTETTTEVTTETDVTTESLETGKIVNPNEELAVTYLFYELQKRYRLSEHLYRVMPVVLVAQEVPSPDQITPAWVIANDWILNRNLLDDSFRPTLKYLASKSVGDDFALRELRKNLRQQRNLVDTLRLEFSAASMQADNRYRALEGAISKRIDQEHAEATDGLVSDIGQFFGRGAGISAIFGAGGGPDPEAAKARELAAKDAHQYALEKAEKASAALKQEVTTLHTLTEQYNKTLQARLDNETQVKRLLVHVRNNIFHYMQAIWSMEPPDQRYLRLHNVQVPILELESRGYRVEARASDDIFAPFREEDTERHRAFLHGQLKHNADGRFDTQPLVQAADLDTLLGFKGNYMIFPMKQHNALTEFMAAPYVDSAFGAMDPDELSNVSLDEFSKYVCCLHETLPPDQFEARKQALKSWLTKLLASPLRNGDEIVVPTGSLFIEALVDPNPILEDFKLKHRELDVYKAQEEVRMAGLENLRLAARLLNAEREDPSIEKKVVIQGGANVGIDVDDV